MAKPVEIIRYRTETAFVSEFLEGDILAAHKNSDFYDLGSQLGVALRILHTIPLNPLLKKWTVMSLKKSRSSRRKKQMSLMLYQFQSIEGLGDSITSIVNAIESTMRLEQGIYSSKMPSSDVSYLHGDIGSGNLIISNNKLHLIDFSRTKAVGFPWDDMSQMPQIDSPAFYTGFLNGYFPNGVDPFFFEYQHTAEIFFRLRRLIENNPTVSRSTTKRKARLLANLVNNPSFEKDRSD